MTLSFALFTVIESAKIEKQVNESRCPWTSLVLTSHKTLVSSNFNAYIITPQRMVEGKS